MQYINSIASKNNNEKPIEHHQPNTSRKSSKKFFILKKESRSHRTSNTTSDSIYIGKYLNTKRNGIGKLILSEHSVYEGNFKNGLFDGKGYYKDKNYIYKGEYLLGKKSGKGKLENLETKTIYEGEFKNDMKNGYGIEQYSDGIIYQGYFKDNKKEGMGKLIMKNNSGYEGQFKKNKICGKGIFKWSETKMYDGEWDNNEISGFGILTENDIKHIGYFSHDKKDGFGASFYTEKKFVIISKWVNDIIDGITIIISLNLNDDKSDDFKNEKIVIIKEGNIIKSEFNENEINEIKKNKDYNEMMKLFRDKFINLYLNKS